MPHEEMRTSARVYRLGKNRAQTWLTELLACIIHHIFKALDFLAPQLKHAASYTCKKYCIYYSYQRDHSLQNFDRFSNASAAQDSKKPSPLRPLP